jgi:hypothetical protein
MSRTFTKLFSSITESTVWGEPYPTRILWVSMLAMADRNGEVFASVPGLARRAGITLEECEAALDTFQKPDRYSRTLEHEGRRIEAIDGGWRLLNYVKYREMRDEEAKRAADAERQRRLREAQRAASLNDGSTSVTPVGECHGEGVTERDSNTMSREVAQAEAEAEAKKKKQRAGKPRSTSIPVDFGISDRVQQWANEKGYTRLAERLEHFVGYAKAKGVKYADWDQAFMNAIRDDWAKLGPSAVAINGAAAASRDPIMSSFD